MFFTPTHQLQACLFKTKGRITCYFITWFVSQKNVSWVKSVYWLLFQKIQIWFLAPWMRPQLSVTQFWGIWLSFLAFLGTACIGYTYIHSGKNIHIHKINFKMNVAIKTYTYIHACVPNTHFEPEMVEHVYNPRTRNQDTKAGGSWFQDEFDLHKWIQGQPEICR